MLYGVRFSPNKTHSATFASFSTLFQPSRSVEFKSAGSWLSLKCYINSAESETSRHFTSSSAQALSSAIMLRIQKPQRSQAPFSTACGFDNDSKRVSGKLRPQFAVVPFQSFQFNIHRRSSWVVKTSAAHWSNHSTFLPFSRNSSP